MIQQNFIENMFGAFILDFHFNQLELTFKSLSTLCSAVIWHNIKQFTTYSRRFYLWVLKNRFYIQHVAFSNHFVQYQIGNTSKCYSDVIKWQTTVKCWLTLTVKYYNSRRCIFFAEIIPYLLEYLFNIDDITFIRHISFKCTINIFFVIFLMWYCDVWMWSYLFVLFLFLWIV